MGYYTKFRFKCRLKKETPVEVIDFLKKTICEGDIGLPEDTVMYTHDEVPEVAIEHEFFKTERWHSLFLQNNWDAKYNTGSTFCQTAAGFWKIEIATEFKNYEQEIGKFIDWISPYVLGRKKKQYLGWSKGEDYDSYQLHYYVERFKVN